MFVSERGDLHVGMDAGCQVRTGAIVSEKPSLDQVLDYGKLQVMKIISKRAADLPKEQKEEIQQTAYMRLIERYPTINGADGWRSYVYNHCRGTVLDYLKFGTGFQEDKWSIRKPEENGSRHVHKIRERVFLTSPDQEPIDIDFVLGQSGVFSELGSNRHAINWDLVARMAATDLRLHIMAKWLRGFKVEKIGEVFGLSRARVGQLLAEFVARFDDPSFSEDTWFLQTCYALGVCEQLGLASQDQTHTQGFTVGWNNQPVDLDSDTTETKVDHSQMALFSVM